MAEVTDNLEKLDVKDKAAKKAKAPAKPKKEKVQHPAGVTRKALLYYQKHIQCPQKVEDLAGREEKTELSNQRLCFVAGGKGDKKKETKLGLKASKADDFGAWYSEAVIESEMISYYDVSGARTISY